VTAAAKKRALRNATVRTNGDRLKVQDEYIFAYPSEIPNRQLPRKMDFHLWLDDNALADASAKQAENGAFEPRRNRQRGEEEKTLGEMPYRFNHERSSAVQSSRTVKQVVSYDRNSHKLAQLTLQACKMRREWPAMHKGCSLVLFRVVQENTDLEIIPCKAIVL